jgi:uncharacterized Tic20 family protein
MSWILPIVILILAIVVAATGSPLINTIGITVSGAAVVSWMGLGVTALLTVIRNLSKKSLRERHRIARDYAERNDW